MTIHRFKFDFELGYLVKSPCKECEQWDRSFPRCAESCELLDRLQRLQAETRSTSRR